MTTISGRWTLQDAKNGFSEVVRRAMADGPQMVTRGGQDAVVIVAAEEWARLSGPRRPLADFLRDSPLADVDLTAPR